MLNLVYIIYNLLCRFYEWDRKSSRKQPYFIHWSDTRPSPEMLELASQTSDSATQAECQTSNIDGFSEVARGRMLTMAGLFDAWKSPNNVNRPFHIRNHIYITLTIMWIM